MKTRKFKGHVLPKYVYVKKKIYLYFVKDDNLVKLPNDPSSPDFYSKYTECLKGEIKGNASRTMKALAIEYFASDKFKKLAKNTSNDYRSKIGWILERCENVQVQKIKRTDIIAMREARKDQPQTSNKTLAVMNVLLEYACDLGWIPFNPGKGVSKLDKQQEQRVPWTDEEIQAFHEIADPRSSLILELCINTGQRLNDVLSMQWSQVSNDPLAGYGISVTQQKTGAQVFIPFSKRLQEIMQRLNNQIDQRGSKYIVVNQRYPEKQLEKMSVQIKMKQLRDKLGVTKTLHDLRHTCAHRLAERGLPAETIMAITGHGSSTMVRHYCAQTAQRVQARKAIEAVDAA